MTPVMFVIPDRPELSKVVFHSLFEDPVLT